MKFRPDFCIEHPLTFIQYAIMADFTSDDRPDNVEMGDDVLRPLLVLVARLQQPSSIARQL